MKKLISLFLIFASICFVPAQIIHGRILNDAGKTISGVNVYIDGTKIRTVSQEDGTFSLFLSAGTNGSLVFQKESYETLTSPAAAAVDKNLKVILLKTNNIEEVVLVPYTEEAYRNYIGYFLENFLGSDLQNVKIKNQRSLKFAYDKKNRTLQVKSPKTLIIENKNLGYEIEYNLLGFSADFDSRMVNYTGTSVFKETKSTPKVKLNRLNAYDGSMLHFLRSIYRNTVAEDTFIVNHVVKVPNPKYPTQEELKILKDFAQASMMKGKEFIIPENIRDISRRKSNEKPHALAIVKTQIPDSAYIQRNRQEVLLTFKDMLQVNYKKYYYELDGKEFVKTKVPVVLSSFLHPEGEIFEVSKDGNISNPDLLITEGDFTKNKIENMLPLDYQPGD
ncbi:carboxypeptidase-like regulatory domain-containing protein [Chryseobacterium sp. SN22]|uniref:carboxypeptidase-like regulatory domain-containing protein n=1 Tax=Chryseobacterium sp. SN22 TaxID=2606431 RepID=UPI0011F08996|nr:carboxypeptidase-like regulatory domain-containing protein [Chryseobacterium sp. SN22]KAA0126738.1 carboxypeptidase-like regulatory domain-containing protein [Chryseobacterium sp. SN22]